MDLSKPKVMGILNVTPDSFSDGGRYVTKQSALKQALKMIKEGADIIDVGGCSSRPGAEDVSEQEELERVVPIIEAISKEISVPISIDTFRSYVAKEAVKAGASLVNDISAGEDDINMIKTVALLKVPYIAMHKKGSPKNMQNNPKYNDVVEGVFTFMLNKKKDCLDAGIKDFIIDPGFGFGKTLEHNYQLLNNLEHFKLLNCAILAGVSRKSMIYKPLGLEPSDAINGTTFLHAIALQNGANILRVHDVKEAVECVQLYQLI